MVRLATSNTASPYWQNIYDPQAEWSPCYYDEAHNLTAYAIYDLPLGKGKKFGADMNKAVDAVIGGWTVSPIVTLHTGFPMELYKNAPTKPAPVARFATRLQRHQHCIRSPGATAAQGGGIQWFDPS